MSDPADQARAVVEEIIRRAAPPHTGSFAGDAAAWPSAGIESSEMVSLIASALRAERAAVWKEAANLMTKQPRNGGFWPHACSSCGRDDEEHHAIEAERVLLNKIAAALAARGEET